MPTDTKAMKYNPTHHKYILDIDWLKEIYEIDFVDKEGSSTKTKNKLLQISTRIYNYIYNHKQRSKRFWEWYLTFNEDVREVIQEAFKDNLLMISAGNNVIRIVPPLIISYEEMDIFISKFTQILSKF